MGIRFLVITQPFRDSRDYYLLVNDEKSWFVDFLGKIYFWRENERGRYAGAEGSRVLLPNQKVGTLGGTFGSTVILKKCFRKFRAWPRMAPVMRTFSSLWTPLSSCWLCCVRVPLIQMLAPYLSMGLTMTLYMVAGLNRQVGPTALLHCIKMPLDFLRTFSICSVQKNFESSVMPIKFVNFCTPISAPSTLTG